MAAVQAYNLLTLFAALVLGWKVVRNQPVVIEDAVNADDFPPFFDFADHR